MLKQPLTRRQRDILAFFRAYTAEHGISPTLEEIARHFELNKVTIFGHLAELERKGVLTRARKNISRGMQIVEGDPREGPSVRVLGRIAAGAPIEALEEPEVFELSDLLPPSKDVYALRVQGDSMIEDGIHEGDLVLVDRRSTAQDGDIVVAILPGEVATLKRLFREPAGYRLEPANSALSPIHTEHLEVRGVVIGIVRRF